MRRSLTFVVGTAAGALLIAAAGVSAHSGGAGLLRMVGVQQSHRGEDASGSRLETPEPGASPEASPTAEPTEMPEASPSPEAAQQAPDGDSESNDGEQDGDSQGGSGQGQGDGSGQRGAGGDGGD